MNYVVVVGGQGGVIGDVYDRLLRVEPFIGDADDSGF